MEKACQVLFVYATIIFMETPKRPRGRPKSLDPATAQVHIRVTPAEKAQYQAAADRERVALSAWLKALADEASNH